MSSILEDFRKFAMRGNMIDLAIGFTVGAAFSTVAKSLVDDLIMPVVGLVIGNVDFEDLFILLREGTEKAPPYTTVADAQAAGAVTFNYGIFVNNVITFLVVALAMFFIIRLVNRIDDELEAEFGEEPKEEGQPTEKKCPYCLSTIPFKAVRCPACTSDLREQVERTRLVPSAGNGSSGDGT